MIPGVGVGILILQTDKVLNRMSTKRWGNVHTLVLTTIQTLVQTQTSSRKGNVELQSMVSVTRFDQVSGKTCLPSSQCIHRTGVFIALH